MASSSWTLYQRLRYIDVLDYDDCYEWDILVAEGYEPFQGTLYGLSLWNLAGRVAQGEIPFEIYDELPLPMRRDLLFFVDKLNELERWFRRCCRVSRNGRVTIYC